MKENKKIEFIKFPANLIHNSAKPGCDLLICDIEDFVMKNFYHFTVSSKCAETLNGILDLTEIKRR